MSERLSGGSASSTGFINSPKMGLAKMRETAPSASTVSVHFSRRERSSVRCSARDMRSSGSNFGSSKG
jgi:hypothetical protein